MLPRVAPHHQRSGEVQQQDEGHDELQRQEVRQQGHGNQAGTEARNAANEISQRKNQGRGDQCLAGEAGQDFTDNQIAVFNLLGQKIEVEITRIAERKVDIDLTGNVPGVYFIRFDTGEDIISRKISFVPW